MRRDAAGEIKKKKQHKKQKKHDKTKQNKTKTIKSATKNVRHLVPAYELFQLGRNVVGPLPRRLFRRYQLRRAGFQLSEACLRWG